MSAESAALSQHRLRSFNREKVPYPRVDSESLTQFLQNSPHLSIEIGCGVGLHPMTWSKQHPDRQLLAIEKTQEKFRKFQTRYRDEGAPSNLFPLHAHAVSVIAHFVKDESVEDYYFLFPNPEPKSPQSRWIRMPFFSEILRTLKPEGRIHFATNKKEYHEEIEDWAVAAWGLQLAKKTLSDKAALGTARTHFEKKYLERGNTIYSTVWRKRSSEMGNLGTSRIG
ncbi:MAG: SAM-dependent methyltransferase [Bdellovibrionales bacterium]